MDCAAKTQALLFYRTFSTILYRIHITRVQTWRTGCTFFLGTMQMYSSCHA